MYQSVINSINRQLKINDVDMTYSSFPTIDYVMFTHIFDLPMWCFTHIFDLPM